MSKSKQVAIKQENAISLQEGFGDLLLNSIGAGMEDFGAGDVAVPFLRIIQALSPEIDKRNEAKFIPGAEIGDIFNTASKQLYKQGVVVVPVFYQKVYLEWTPRTKGGGLVKNWGGDSTVLTNCTKNEKGKDITSEGNEIVETAMHYVMTIDTQTGSYEQAIISMSSSGLKVSKEWNHAMINVQKIPDPRTNGQTTMKPPCFYTTYKITTVHNTKDSNQWENWKIEPFGPIPAINNGGEIFKAAYEFREIIKSGAVKVQIFEQEVVSSNISDDEVL
jgi:hypothetical protein